MEHKRRTMKKQSVEINFNQDMVATTAQEGFLANNTNKARFIDGLKICFIEDYGMSVLQDHDDADNLIVQTAINTLNHSNRCIVVGTDLLVLLIHKCKVNQEVYYYMPGTPSIPDATYNIQNVQQSMIPHLKKYILFLYAIMDCDTISALFFWGKLSIKILLCIP